MFVWGTTTRSKDESSKSAAAAASVHLRLYFQLRLIGRMVRPEMRELGASDATPGAATVAPASRAPVVFRKSRLRILIQNSCRCYLGFTVWVREKRQFSFPRHVYDPIRTANTSRSEQLA